ncbi:tetratricopeptide repeat protein [Streptosporangium pseudovulgare]|uniref:NB-ARC domain-containing protein n=1 Tax=Streptosporangium pseudovulgare TaxID=35765 RepID=A0ABQ2R9T9_9ACTN|nr:tetratricopeptide repeat protein [Streptosporangium pseudovulgare]GGQ17124.1 hypothetical protein GCM10010140_54120 [Streptosporangium pseudovulgare]
MEFFGWFGGATVIEIFFNTFLDVVPRWVAFAGGMALYGVVSVVRRLRRPKPLPSPKAQPRGLPAPVEPLFGRDAEIAEVTGRAGEHRTVVVRGVAGIGTSALAVAAGWALVPDPERQHYVDLRGQNRSSPESRRSVAERVLRTLGRPLETATSLEAAAREVAAALRDPGHLLLLDNVSRWRQVGWLPRDVPESMIIIAGALDADADDPLPGDVAVVRLGPLEPADGVALLRSMVPDAWIEADPAATRELAVRFLGTPETAVGIGRWLVDNPMVPIATLVTDLAGQGAHDLALQRVLGMRVARMNAAARRLLALLAHAPVAELGIDEIVALTGRPERDAAQAMEELCRHGLVDKVRESRYRVTDSARPAVRAPEGRERAAWQDLAEHLADRADSFVERLPAKDARDWFALEDRTLLQMLGEYRPNRGKGGPLWRIADALEAWFAFEQRTEERRETALALAKAASNLGNQAVQATAELRLCLIALMLGDPGAAERHLGRAERLLTDPDSWPAQLHLARAVTLLARGDEYTAVESSLVRYGQALPGGDVTGRAVLRLDMAVLHVRWGQVCDSQGRRKEARHLYEGAEELLMRALGGPASAGDTHVEAHVEAHVREVLALVHRYQGQEDEALEGWARAAELYERSGDGSGRLRCQVHRAAALPGKRHEEAAGLLRSALRRLPPTGVTTALANLHLARLDPAGAPERRGAGLAALAPWNGISEPLQVAEIRRRLERLPSSP